MSTELVEIIKPLTCLKGTWEGGGRAVFPTHDEFAYEDIMRFKLIERAFDKEPLIHFEEIAWVVNKGERAFKHWETGYFKPEPDGSIQLYVCHNTGRIEVTYGTLKSVDSGTKSLEMVFISESIRNDKGTKVALSSRREFLLNDDTLVYRVEMSTKEVPDMTHHLSAELVKKNS
ncbi:MAG: FABP family protein [Ekhidna sp.]